jgi:hypothetical protein
MFSQDASGLDEVVDNFVNKLWNKVEKFVLCTRHAGLRKKSNIFIRLISSTCVLYLFTVVFGQPAAPLCITISSKEVFVVADAAFLPLPCRNTQKRSRRSDMYLRLQISRHLAPDIYHAAHHKAHLLHELFG